MRLRLTKRRRSRAVELPCFSCPVSSSAPRVGSRYRHVLGVPSPPRRLPGCERARQSLGEPMGSGGGDLLGVEVDVGSSQVDQFALACWVHAATWKNRPIAPRACGLAQRRSASRSRFIRFVQFLPASGTIALRYSQRREAWDATVDCRTIRYAGL